MTRASGPCRCGKTTSGYIKGRCKRCGRVAPLKKEKALKAAPKPVAKGKAAPPPGISPEGMAIRNELEKARLASMARHDLMAAKMKETGASEVSATWTKDDHSDITYKVLKVERPIVDPFAGAAPIERGPAKEKAATKVKAAPPEKKERSEKKDTMSGKRLFALTKVNPNREGSVRAKTMSILIAAGKKGITFDEFIAAGGKKFDLNFNIERGHAKAE